ncbi:sodium/hydrogen exchanger 11-like [Rhynchocyon petersi]
MRVGHHGRGFSSPAIPTDTGWSIDKLLVIPCQNGCLRACLKNSEVLVLAILSLSGFILGQLAYRFVKIHKIIYPLLSTPSFALYCYFLPLIIFVAALDVDFYILKNVFWQVLLTAFISLSTSVAIIGYVAMKFSRHLWDLQSCILFSFTLSIIDPIHSVKPLEAIGVSKMFIDLIRGESLIICGITSLIFGFFRTTIIHINMVKGSLSHLYSHQAPEHI